MRARGVFYANHAEPAVSRSLFRKFGADRIFFLSVDRRIDVENRLLRHVLTHGFTARGRHWKLATPVHAEHRPESQRTLFVSVSGRIIDPKNVILDLKHVRD